ncbi:MAG: glycerophosphodiester phosphodiesterase family protein [Gemmatimonadaceae bacterium]
MTSDLVVIAHRGNSANAPENTLEAFQQAVAIAVDGVEFDVRLTADGQLVVMHDPTVDRTTDGSGEVARLTLEELRALDAGYRFGPHTYPYRERGIKVPTVAEVLDVSAQLDVIIEVKAIEAAESLLALIRSRGDEGRVTVGSFVPGALRPFRSAGVRTAASFQEARNLLVPAVLGIKRHRVPYSVLSVPPRYRGIPLPLGAMARSLGPAGVAVQVWTVNDPREALQLWREGVHGILSDDPATILEARASLR